MGKKKSHHPSVHSSASEEVGVSGSFVMRRYLLPAPKKPWWRKSWDHLIILMLLGGVMVFYPGQNVYTAGFGELLAKSARKPVAAVLPPPAPYPTNMTGTFPEDDIGATGVIVQDLGSSAYLWKRNEALELAPASTTKIMTALVALDLYKLDDVVELKSVLGDGQVMGLVVGEKITVENLLYGMLIQSGNDAAYALAEHHPKGYDGFIEAMNQKAQALHLIGSRFTNPMGFDNPDHIMTATDLANLARVALTDKTIAKMVAIPQITISDITYTHYHSLKNVNQLLGKIPGVAGIKTGWTEAAGENLVTLVERSGHRILIVVLHSQDRFGETEKLINWIFGNYKWEELKVS